MSNHCFGSFIHATLVVLVLCSARGLAGVSSLEIVSSLNVQFLVVDPIGRKNRVRRVY